MTQCASKSSQPIGLFDSGVGGLTVAKALRDALPGEDLIYFGDTAHMPYGERSDTAIINYASKISDFLLSQSVKMIVIACNSAASVATQTLQQTHAHRVPIVNVIDPVLAHLLQTTASASNMRTIGLIGTRPTIHAQRYQHPLLAHGFSVKAYPTPLLASAIEEGFSQTPVMQHLIAHYLGQSALSDIDTLILGCTHYPVIKPEIEHFFEHQQRRLQVTDPSTQVAQTVKTTLSRQQLLNPQTHGHIQCYLSDVTASFTHMAPRFFSAPINITHYPIWD